MNKRARCAVVAAEDANTIAAVIRAYHECLISPILIGDSELIGEMLRVLKEEGEDAAFSYVRGLLREEKQKSTK